MPFGELRWAEPLDKGAPQFGPKGSAAAIHGGTLLDTLTFSACLLKPPGR